MSPDCHSEFDELGDVAPLVLGSICVVNWDQGHSLLSIELMFVDVGLIDGTAGATAVKEGLGCQVLTSRTGLYLYRDQEVVFAAV